MAAAFTSAFINNPLKYGKARVDIKNNGNSDNLINIINYNDSSLEITHPNWFANDNGRGTVIQSLNSNMDLEIECIGDGELNIKLRGIDFRDSRGNRVPIYIDYKKLTIDDKDYLDKHVLISHDRPFGVKKDVKNHEIVKIHLEWKPVNHTSMYADHEKILRDENSKLKKELAKIQETLKNENTG